MICPAAKSTSLGVSEPASACPSPANPRNSKKSELSCALKLRDARVYLGGISVPTGHRLIKRGLLRPNRSTRHLLFPIRELDRFLKDGMT
jgi:hypothetical protein